MTTLANFVTNLSTFAASNAQGDLLRALGGKLSAATASMLSRIGNKLDGALDLKRTFSRRMTRLRISILVARSIK